MPRGRYRVVVLESGGQLRVSDFAGLEGARQYANDVASESDEPSPLAYVFDDRLQSARTSRAEAIRPAQSLTRASRSAQRA